MSWRLAVVILESWAEKSSLKSLLDRGLHVAVAVWYITPVANTSKYNWYLHQNSSVAYKQKFPYKEIMWDVFCTCSKSFLLPICLSDCNCQAEFTSDLHTCTQASRSQSISFEDPHQIWETIFELNLRVSYLRRLTGATELVTKPSLGLICCQWDCMATAPCPIPRLVRNNLGMDPHTSISRINALKHMTVKTIMILMNSLKTGCHGWSLELIKQYCFTKKHRVCFLFFENFWLVL